MASMSSRLYINKQQVAFIIHPKQTNKYPDIKKKCREIVRIQNKTMYLLHPYLRVPFSGKVLFSFKRLKISIKKPWKTSLYSLLSQPKDFSSKVPLKTSLPPFLKSTLTLRKRTLPRKCLSPSNQKHLHSPAGDAPSNLSAPSAPEKSLKPLFISGKAPSLKKHHGSCSRLSSPQLLSDYLSEKPPESHSFPTLLRFFL